MALGTERGQRRSPPFAHWADAVDVGNPDIGQVHLVELSLAGHVDQRAHVYPWRPHVESKVGDAFVFGLVRVGPSQQHGPLGQVSERGPHLLAVDHPLVTVTDGRRSQRRHVRPGPWLRKQLAPPFRSAHQWRQQMALGGFLRPLVDRRCGQWHPRAERHVRQVPHVQDGECPSRLLAGQAPAAVLHGIVRSDPAGFTQGADDQAPIDGVPQCLDSSHVTASHGLDPRRGHQRFEQCNELSPSGEVGNASRQVRHGFRLRSCVRPCLQARRRGAPARAPGPRCGPGRRHRRSAA